TGVAQGDEDEGEGGRPFRYELLEPLLRECPVRQIRQCIVVGQIGDVRLTFGDGLLHRVERRREATEFLTAGSLDGDVVTTLPNTFGGAYQLADGTGRTATQQGTDGRRQRQRDAVNQQQRIAHVTVGRQHPVHGFLHDDLNRVTAPVDPLCEAQVIRWAAARRAGLWLAGGLRSGE